MNHFKGKEAFSHLIDARIKGKIAVSEIHGAELPGHISAAADAAKETAIVFLLLWEFLGDLSSPLALLPFLSAFALWKVGRSAILGWGRLERLHRLIEEERYEIEHHRSQEKEELRALYQAKGFTGKLLEEVIEHLMADDNRLLQVMLEEELGLKLESHEHPLKQAIGALFGVIGAALAMSFGLFVLPHWGPLVTTILVIALSAGTTAQLEKNRFLPTVIWHLGLTLLTAGVSYFLAQLFL